MASFMIKDILNRPTHLHDISCTSIISSKDCESSDGQMHFSISPRSTPTPIPPLILPPSFNSEADMTKRMESASLRWMIHCFQTTPAFNESQEEEGRTIHLRIILIPNLRVQHRSASSTRVEPSSRTRMFRPLNFILSFANLNCNCSCCKTVIVYVAFQVPISTNV